MSNEKIQELEKALLRLQQQVESVSGLMGGLQRSVSALSMQLTVLRNMQEKAQELPDEPPFELPDGVFTAFEDAVASLNEEGESLDSLQDDYATAYCGLVAAYKARDEATGDYNIAVGAVNEAAEQAREAISNAAGTYEPGSPKARYVQALTRQFADESPHEHGLDIESGIIDPDEGLSLDFDYTEVETPQTIWERVKAGIAAEKAKAKEAA